jgi:hypothetical protein
MRNIFKREKEREFGIPRKNDNKARVRSALTDLVIAPLWSLRFIFRYWVLIGLYLVTCAVVLILFVPEIKDIFVNLLLSLVNK